MCAPVRDRVMGRRQRLSQYLAAEDLSTADIAALPAVKVVLDALELQELDQIAKNRMHAKDLGGGRFTAVDHDARTTNENRIICRQKQGNFRDVNRLAESLRR